MPKSSLNDREPDVQCLRSKLSAAALLAASWVPPRRRRNHQEQLDRLKHALAVEVVKQHSAEQIRRHSIDNLVRWRSAGVWGPAYQRWFDVLSSADDGALYALMVGHDEEANRLRQSPPFVGLLPQPVLEELRTQARRTKTSVQRPAQR